MLMGSTRHSVVVRDGLDVDVLEPVGSFRSDEDFLEFDQAVRDLVQRQPSTVLVSFGRLDGLLSSAAIGVLMRALQRIKRLGGQMVFGRLGDDGEGGAAGVLAKLLPPPPGGANAMMALDEELRRAAGDGN